MDSLEPVLAALEQCRGVIERFLASMDDMKTAVKQVEHEFQVQVAAQRDQLRVEQSNLASFMTEKETMLDRLSLDEQEVKTRLSESEHELERVRALVKDLKRQVTGL